MSKLIEILGALGFEKQDERDGAVVLAPVDRFFHYTEMLDLGRGIVDLYNSNAGADPDTLFVLDPLSSSVADEEGWMRLHIASRHGERS